MAALCVLAGGKSIALVASLFSLAWTHSVEKTEWREQWQVRDGALLLLEASVKGSGAGMDPGEGAVLDKGWWVWKPDLQPVPELVLAASGATVSAWSLCHSGGCLDLGAEPGSPVVIAPCRP